MILRRIFALFLALGLAFGPLVNTAIAASGCTYPTVADAFVDKTAGDSLSVAEVNKFHCAIERVHTELGLLPKGSFATVKARLDDIDTRFVKLLGTAGGQTLIGGTASGEHLSLQSTSNATRGTVKILDSLAYDVSSPASITANQNDYDPARKSLLRLTSDASREVTGFAGTAPGRVLEIFNIGTFLITLKHESSSSTAANRITSAHGRDIEMRPGYGARLVYDTTSSRWRGERIGGAATFTMVKIADQTLTQSNTTPQNITDLSFECPANASYEVNVRALLNAANGTSDFKFAWTGPAGFTMFWGPQYLMGDTQPLNWYWGPLNPAQPPNALLTEGSTFSVASLAGTNGTELAAIVRCAGTAGTVQFQVSQNTSNASDNKVLKDSLLRVTRLN